MGREAHAEGEKSRKKLAVAPAAVCELHDANWASSERALGDQCREFCRIKVTDDPLGSHVVPSQKSLFVVEKW